MARPEALPWEELHPTVQGSQNLPGEPVVKAMLASGSMWVIGRHTVHSFDLTTLSSWMDRTSEIEGSSVANFNSYSSFKTYPSGCIAGVIYIWTGAPCSQGDMQVFDTTSTPMTWNVWTSDQMSNMPTFRSGVEFTAIDEKLYLFGGYFGQNGGHYHVGWPWTDPTGYMWFRGENFRTSTDFQVFDPTKKEWIRLGSQGHTVNFICQMHPYFRFWQMSFLRLSLSLFFSPPLGV